MTAQLTSPRLSKPAAWRCRTTSEPEWNYGESKLSAKDLFRKEPGFEEQALYAPARSQTDGKAST
jgi:hypothetical protein